MPDPSPGLCKCAERGRFDSVIPEQAALGSLGLPTVSSIQRQQISGGVSFNHRLIILGTTDGNMKTRALPRKPQSVNQILRPELCRAGTVDFG